MLGFRGSGFGVLGFWVWGGVGSVGIVPKWWYGSAVRSPGEEDMFPFWMSGRTRFRV